MNARTPDPETSSMATPPLVEMERKKNLAWVYLNHPERLNAMNETLGATLVSALKELGEDQEVHVILLSGRGKAFSAGGDLELLEENTRIPPHLVQQRMRRFYGSFLFLRELPKPVLAVLNGYAMGAGMCLALAADLRIASESAQLSLNFTRLGLTPGMGATHLLTRLVGYGRALELLFSGRVIPAREALALGLVQRVVPDDELKEAAEAWAEELLRAGPIALAYTKLLVYRSLDLPLEEILLLESYTQALAFGTEDLKEGIRALRRKESPRFRGK